jgi:hypothetical protein
MAEPNPGQIITPDSNPEPPKQPQPQSEVSVNLSHPDAVAPSSQQPPVSSSPTVNATPIPNPNEPVITSDAVQQPLTSVPSQEPLPPITQANPSAPEAPAGGFAPQLQVNDMQPNDFSEAKGDNEGSISWTASEYIAHQKSTGWFMALGLVTILFAVLVYFVTSRDILSVIVIVLAAIVFGIYAGKRPKEQQYAVSPAGISIGPKTYSFDQLRTFAIVDEGAFSSIMFLPMKRFMPPLSIYYDPKDEENIVNVLSNYLPMDAQKRDIVDNLMRKIRF